MTKESVVENIREKLDGMIGKTYKYGAGTHLFKNYFIYPDRERVEIITDKKGFDRTFDTMLDFLNFFREVGKSEKTKTELKEQVKEALDETEDYNRSSVIIYATMNYSKFKFMLGNRQLNEVKIKKIIREIDAGNDMLQYYPIQVRETKDKRLDILDGQHRFFICKKLKRPVYFILVEEEKSLPEIAKINSNVEKWKKDDFINCYVQNGNENYKILQSFLNEYRVSLTVALQLLTKANPGNESGFKCNLIEDFREGQFEIKTLEEAKALVDECRKFAPFTNCCSRSFVIAIYKIKKASLITIDEIVEVYNKRPEMLTEQANYKSYINTLEQIVNVGKKNRIVIA